MTSRAGDPSGEPERIDRPGPAPISRSPRRPRRRRPRALGAPPPAGLATSQKRGKRRGVGAARAVGGAIGMALAANRGRLPAVEEDVDHLLAVAAGDDDRSGPERQHLAGQILLGVLSSAPVSARASGMFGVTTVASGSRRSTRALRASSSSRVAPLSATITGSITTGASPTNAKRLDDGIDRRRRAEHPDLDGVDPDVLGDRPHLGDDRRRRDRLDRARPRRCSAR